MIDIFVRMLSVWSVATIPPPAVLELFDTGAYHSVDESRPERTLLYRLFRPVDLRPGERRPLVVWLHGYGELEFEQINVGQLQHTGLVVPTWEAARDLPFFLLAVQCPKDQRGFFRTAIGAPGMADFSPEPGEVVVEIVKKLFAEEVIDETRVTLTGISGGATDAWEMAMRYPDMFAAMAPLGGGEVDLSRIKNLVNMPVWAFHSRIDTLSPVEHPRTAVARLRELGGEASLTEVEGRADYAHDCHTKAFLDFRVHEWLAAQQRGVDGPRPLEGQWRLWLSIKVEEALASGVPFYLPAPIAIAVCWWAYRRQIHKVRARQSRQASSAPAG